MFRALWQFIAECVEALRDEDEAAAHDRCPQVENYQWHSGIN
jgi:hypothetical protein